jgi:type I restriction enzyme S subunit
VERSEVRAIGQRCVAAAGFEPSFARPHSPGAMDRVLIAETGDVLLNSTGTGTIGRSCVFLGEGTFIVDGHVTVLRPQPDRSDGRWLNALLRTPWGQRFLETQCYAGSTNQVELSRTQLAAARAPVPGLSEQRQIAAILDTIDDAIRKTEQIIAKLKQVKQGLLHDLLTRGIDDNGELRDPERHPEQFKDSPQGRIPRGWERAALGAHLSGSPQNGLYKPGSQYGDSGTPIVRIDGFYDGALNHVSTFKRVRLSEAETAFYRLYGGDILINRVNSIDYVGKAGLVPAWDEAVTFESNIMRLRLERTHLEPAYVIRVLCAQPARRFFFTRAKSAIAQASVNQTDVRDVPLLVPGLDEQKRIVTFLDTFESRLTSEAVGLSKLRLLKAGVMEDLLTGRVRVTSLLESAGP